MNIAHIEENSFIYGPGCRYVIWVQGCSIRCKGCWNTEMWSFEKKFTFSTSEIFDKIVCEKNFIEGITILGGEPFDQFYELFDLLKQVRNTQLSSIVYTGYTINEIQKMDKTEVLNYTDILITDRYDETSNQNIRFLTSRYTQNDLPEKNEIEISFNETGKMNMYGYFQ